MLVIIMFLFLGDDDDEAFFILPETNGSSSCFSVKDTFFCSLLNALIYGQSGIIFISIHSVHSSFIFNEFQLQFY